MNGHNKDTCKLPMSHTQETTQATKCDFAHSSQETPPPPLNQAEPNSYITSS